MENKTTAHPGSSAIDHKVPSRTRVMILRPTLALHAFGNPIRNDRAVMHRGAQFCSRKKSTPHGVSAMRFGSMLTISSRPPPHMLRIRIVHGGAGPISYPRGAEKAFAAALTSSIGAFGTRRARTFACRMMSLSPLTLTMT